MFKKIILIIVTLIIVSFFYYSFDPFFLPRGYNTKMVMAAVGVVLIAWQLIQKRSLSVKRELIPIFGWAVFVSLIAMFSMVFNNTIDTSYASYIISMSVWLCAAYVVCLTIKKVHGRIDVELLCDYLIVVSVIQCFITLWIDNDPSFQHFVDTKIVRGIAFMHEIDRLYGIGCGLDTAGIHFSLCLIMILYLLKKNRKDMSIVRIIYYLFSYIILAIVGSMIARTTYVGIFLSIAYIVLTIDYSDGNISRSTLRILASTTVILFVGIIFAIYEYNHDASIRHWLRFAFEGFFNYFEKGEYSVASNDTLQGMIKWPSKLKTWIIGDGYFINPYYNDPNFIWQGQNKQGYYMDTDIGYIRFIFYFGVIGLSLFVCFFLQCTKTTINLLKEYKGLILFTLITGLIVWLKVATDVFFQFALFMCVGFLTDKNETDDVIEEDE